MYNHVGHCTPWLSVHLLSVLKPAHPAPWRRALKKSSSAFPNEQAGIRALARKLSTGSSLSGRFPGVLQGPTLSLSRELTRSLSCPYVAGGLPNTCVSRRDAGNAVPPLVLGLSDFAFVQALCTSSLPLPSVSLSFDLLAVIFRVKKLLFVDGRMLSFSLVSPSSFLLPLPPNTLCLRLFSCKFLLFSVFSRWISWIPLEITIDIMWGITWEQI